MCRGSQIFQKSWGHLQILDARRVTWIKFQTEDPNSGVMCETVIWRPLPVACEVHIFTCDGQQNTQYRYNVTTGSIRATIVAVDRL